MNHVFTPRGAKKSRCRGTSNSVMSEAASSDSSVESSETSDSATLRSWVSFLGQRPSKTYRKFVKTRRKPMKIRRIVLENPTDMVKTLIKDKKKKARGKNSEGRNSSGIFKSLLGWNLGVLFWFLLCVSICKDKEILFFTACLFLLSMDQKHNLKKKNTGDKLG